MENSKVNFKFIPVLQSFTKTEFKEFGKFVKSPFYNSNKKIPVFYNALKPFYPEFNSKSLSKQNLFRKIYDSKKFNNRELEKLSSSFHLLAEKYLSVKGTENGCFCKEYFLLQELNNRKLSSQFKRELKSLKTTLKNKNSFQENPLPIRYLMEKEINRFCYKSENEDITTNNAQQIADGLVGYFLAGILKVYCYMLNEIKNVYDFNYKMDFMEPVIKYIESNPEVLTPYTKMLFCCIRLLLYEKHEDFENLKGIVYKNFEKIDKEDRYDMCEVLISYCHKKINEDSRGFLKELFGIYKKFLQCNALMPHGYLHHLNYKVIVNCAVSLKEFEWAENFIETYKQYLKDKHKESSYYFNMGRLHFVKCEYEKALDYYAKVSLEDITYKMDIKWQMVRIYYELGEADSFLSLVDSYKHFLVSNNSVSNESKKTQLRHIGYVSKLFKLRNNFDERALNELKAEFLGKNYIIARTWFLKKTEEIFLINSRAKAV